MNNNTSLTGFDNAWTITHFSIFSVGSKEKESKLCVKNVEAIYRHEFD